MTSSLPFQIQSLGSFSEQTLVLLHVAQLQAADRTASPAEVRTTFIKLRLPPPSNISQYLSVLARGGYLMQPAAGKWALTPFGEERIRGLMSGVESAEFSQLGTESREPTFGDVPHHLLPPEFAPAPFQPGIARFLEGHPLEQNVFCISQFPRSDAHLIGQAIEACREACTELALDLHLASDRTVEDLLFGNIAAAMWASRFGIAIFEDRRGEGINYNVTLEVGAMLMTGRRCLLLKDESIDRLPTDLVGHIYQSVDLEDVDHMVQTVIRWGKEDLGLVG